MAVALLFMAAVGMCVQVLNAPRAVAAFDESICIVLDAGHGGVDGGVVGRCSNIKESDLNLAITYKLKDELEGMGFQVVLTRKTEAGLYDTVMKGFKKRDMQKRREIIQDKKPAMVLSIHQNFYPSKQPRGGQVFYSKGNMDGAKLANGLQKKINGLYAEEGAKQRVVAAGDFFILQCVDAPSVIVECGFLSNEKDEALLIDENWQKRLAKSLAEGTMEYFSDASA